MIFTTCHFENDIIKSCSVKYDKVVDRSTFKPDSEQTRIKSLTGAGSTSQGVFDSDTDSHPSDLELAIRSGKLDKAEVSQILLSKTDEIKDSISSEKKQKETEKLEKISKARQEHLDKMVGFDGSVHES